MWDKFTKFFHHKSGVRFSMLRTAGIAFALSIVVAQAQLANNCVVDWNGVHQKIDGFGASSAFIGNWAPVWADMFFSTNTGIGLSLLRARIAPDGTTAETNIMQMAQARGARVWCTPWSPPGAFKSSGITSGGNFDSVDNQAYANQLANFVSSMKTNYQVPIYAVSIQNEPDYSTLTYESCAWSAQQIHDFIPYLYLALSNNGVGTTQILMPEEGLWDFAQASVAMSDLTTSNLVGILGSHDYDYTVTPVAGWGKSLWETEVSTFGTYDGSISNALYWANQIHAFMTVVQADAFNYWWMLPQTPDNEGLTDLSGNPAKRMYVLGQFSRFVRPGYFRIDASNLPGTLVSAYKDPVSGNFAIVAINTNSTSVTQAFALTNFNTAFVTPWITSGTLSLSNQAVVPVTNASFSYVLPPQSVVTFVGQTNLNVTIEVQPQNQMATAGHSAAFSISASGATPLSYFWLENGAYLAGATNTTCLVSNVPYSNSPDSFSCVVSNAYGAVTSAVATLTVTLPGCVEPPPGISGWWPGESNAVDIIGGNNGVLLNGAGFTNAVVGKGFAFDGGMGCVQLPRNLFPSPNGAPFSIELWFETTTGGVILAQQASTPFASYQSGGWVPELYVGTNGVLYVQLYWNGTYDQIASSTPLNDGAFHHLAVTYDGLNEIVYVDGLEIGAERLPYSNFTDYFYCELGTGYTQGWPAGAPGWYTFNGIIDELSLYTNALTAGQVQSIYNAGSAGKCTDELVPVITRQPSSQIASAGSTVAFSVSAISVLPLSYQWLKSGVPVPGATGPTCYLYQVSTNYNGSQFNCVVSNINGAVTSLVATLSVTLPGCVEPPAGIVAWWPGQDNALDVISGYNGSLMDGLAFTNALVGDGFLFNGGMSYLQLPQTVLAWLNGNSFSLELWFQTTAGGVILAQQSGAPSNTPSSSWLPELYVGSDGNLHAQMFWNGTFNQISTSTPVNDGAFHHLAVTYDGTNEAVYLDGSEIGVKALQSSSAGPGVSCQFGTGYTQYWPEASGGWYTFNGIIDQPALYSQALTPAQVQSLYQASTSGKCTDELLPSITVQPTNQTVPAGAAAAFSVSATSLAPLSYQWLAGTATVIGATNSSIFLANAALSNSGTQFTCVISNVNGVVTSLPAILTVTNTTSAFTLTAAILPNHQVQMTVTSPPGDVFRVLGSTNLLAWQLITTLTNLTGSVQFTDSPPAYFPSRFYRLAMP